MNLVKDYLYQERLIVYLYYCQNEIGSLFKFDDNDAKKILKWPTDLSKKIYNEIKSKILNNTNIDFFSGEIFPFCIFYNYDCSKCDYKSYNPKKPYYLNCRDIIQIVEYKYTYGAMYENEFNNFNFIEPNDDDYIIVIIENKKYYGIWEQGFMSFRYFSLCELILSNATWKKI